MEIKIQLIKVDLLLFVEIWFIIIVTLYSILTTNVRFMSGSIS